MKKTALVGPCALLLAAAGCGFFIDPDELVSGTAGAGPDGSMPEGGGVQDSGGDGNLTDDAGIDTGLDTGVDAPPCTTKSTGLKEPKIAGAEGAPAWTSSDQVKTEDNAGAILSLGTDQEGGFLVARKFDFGIPASATIQGVRVVIRRKGETSDEIRDREVRLYFQGSATGDDRKISDKWPLAYASQDYGASTTTWGVALTPTVVNDEGFGVRLQARNASLTLAGAAVVDVIKVDVTYCE